MIRGTTTAAKMLMMTTTTNTSIKENPRIALAIGIDPLKQLLDDTAWLMSFGISLIIR